MSGTSGASDRGPDGQDRTPQPSELGRLPDGEHAAAERGDHGEAVDDVADSTPPAGGAVPPEQRTAEFPDAGDARDRGTTDDPSEHHRWGDTAYGVAVE